MLVVLWVLRAPLKTRTSIASAALAFCEALRFAVLSHYEHVKNIRPSSLLNLALAISLGFDVVRMRTFVKMDYDNLITSIFMGTIATKSGILLLEGKSKKMFLKGVDSERPPEETSGIFSRSIFWWLNPLLREGYRKVLTLKDLYDLDEHLPDHDIQTRFERTWSTYSRSKHSCRLVRSRIAALRLLFLRPVLSNMLGTAILFAQPFLISRMIEFVSSEETLEVGYMLGLTYFSRIHFHCSPQGGVLA